MVRLEGMKLRRRLPSTVRSPLSPVPSLRSRRRRPPATELLLAIPRISPERELAVIQALIKPQTGRSLRHQIDTGEQAWPADAAERIGRVTAAAARHLHLHLTLHQPPEGEFHAIGRSSPNVRPAALAAALLLSHMFPGVWIVFDRLFIRDGNFYRRERGVKLNLRPASNVHLTRQLRAAYTRALREL